ncbi:MAG: hypothetical protein RR705_09365 [Lachnospiraceae bacterium]
MKSVGTYDFAYKAQNICLSTHTFHILMAQKNTQMAVQLGKDIMCGLLRKMAII